MFVWGGFLLHLRSPQSPPRASLLLFEPLPCLQLSSPSDALATLASGFESRSTGATRMNAHSSRSHAVFTLTVEQNPKPTGGDDGEDGYKISKFNLVDLAGRCVGVPVQTSPHAPYRHSLLSCAVSGRRKLKQRAIVYERLCTSIVDCWLWAMSSTL